jgi:hypothetical protein
LPSRETLSSNALPTLGHHYITPSSCGYATTGRWRSKHLSCCPARRKVLEHSDSGGSATLISDTGSGHPLAALAAGKVGFAETLGDGHSLATRASSPSRCGSTSGRPAPTTGLVGEPHTVVGPAGDLRVAPGLVGDAGQAWQQQERQVIEVGDGLGPDRGFDPRDLRSSTGPEGFGGRPSPGARYWRPWTFR